jgi:cytochrome P450
MQSFVWHVLSNPQIHQRLVDELLASELSEIVQFKEAQSLRYFQACFKEAMRLQPAVGFNITRKVPPGGAEINGTWLPGGTQVAVNAWVMHREEIFGSYPDSFKPERWLDISEDQVKAMERCMFQVR